MTQLQPSHAPLASDERPVKPALRRGWRMKCPNCGTGPMMRGYLKTRDHCPVCDEDLSHHRADDGPAYVTVLITGHIVAPLMLWAYVEFRPDPLVMAVSFSTGFIVVALYLLPRFKGMFVALQWAKRMHGFAAASPGATGS